MHYRRLSKLIKNRANQLKKDFYQAKASNINEAVASRDLENLFRNAKQHNAFNNKASLPSVCNALKDHFQQHFNKAIPSEIPHELVNMPGHISTSLLHIPTDFINGDPPDETEVISAIKQLRLREENEEAFKTTSGVRQGGCESPYCFNLYLDYILRIFEYECQHENLHITIPYRIPNEASDRSQRSEEKDSGVLSLLWLGYADDLSIITNSAVKLQTAMENLYNILTRFGLQMSLDKTRTMVMSDKYDETTYPETICTINNEHLKNIETWTEFHIQ
ncbi:hypothetical protein AC249_AIPGENE14758 [Exaiptasia diaphana]|nr:hypothetical protein AC249_AIPGENE14758 [Exaiptasia diaphana]